MEQRGDPFEPGTTQSRQKKGMVAGGEDVKCRKVHRHTLTVLTQRKRLNAHILHGSYSSDLLEVEIELVMITQIKTGHFLVDGKEKASIGLRHIIIHTETAGAEVFGVTCLRSCQNKIQRIQR